MLWTFYATNNTTNSEYDLLVALQLKMIPFDGSHDTRDNYYPLHGNPLVAYHKP